MDTLTVDLGERSYPIHIASDIITTLSSLMPVLNGRQLMVVTNTTIAPLYLEHVVQSLSSIADVDTVILPDGEQYKNLDTLNSILPPYWKRSITVKPL